MGKIMRNGELYGASDAADISYNGGLGNTVKDALDTVGGKFIVVKEVEYGDNIRVEAGALIQSSNFSVALDGYTPIGIVGIAVENGSDSGIRSSRTHMYYYKIGGNILSFILRNDCDDYALVKITFQVLYIKK